MPRAVRAGAPQQKMIWELSRVAGQEGAMAAPTMSRDGEQQIWVRTRSRNRDQIRHGPVIPQQGCGEEAGLRASQEAKTMSSSQSQGGKQGIAAAAV